MRSSSLSLLLAGIAGSSATAAVTVMASAYAFGGADGFVVVDSPAAAPAAGESTQRPADARYGTPAALRSGDFRAYDPLAPEADAVPTLAGTVRERLADPAYASALLRDEPTALRFLFDSALQMDRPDRAWALLEAHAVFAAHLGEPAWAELVRALERARSIRAPLALAHAQELFGPAFAR